jgi:uncharacterized membrane protein YphA (DoxX/SURF4 family)
MEGWKRGLAWVEEHRGDLFDVMRIYLGIGLFVKGIQFITDIDFLLNVLRQSATIEFKFRPVETFVAHYIAMAHLAGGLLLAAGIMTRISALFQLPILVGAVFFVHADSDLLAHNTHFDFAALVLFLLVLIFIHGGGRLSVDHYLSTR